MIWGRSRYRSTRVVVCQLLMRLKLNALIADACRVAVWLIVAFSLHALFGGGS